MCCPAKSAMCNHCDQMGHYAKYKKAENFPKQGDSAKKKIYIAWTVEENEFWDEGGNLYQKFQNHMLSTVKGRKELLIEFEVEKELNSIDKRNNSQTGYWIWCQSNQQKNLPRIIPWCAVTMFCSDSKEFWFCMCAAIGQIQVLSFMEKEVQSKHGSHDPGSYS